MFRKKRVGATVISSGPWILTIEFIANLFYGWFANYIGVWVFNSMGTAIDWFYPFLVMISFLWFDIQRIQQEKKRTKSFEDSELRERLPLELVNNEMHKFRMDNLMSDRVNSRVTALFGKFAGVVIGGFNLILLNS